MNTSQALIYTSYEGLEFLRVESDDGYNTSMDLRLWGIWNASVLNTISVRGIEVRLYTKYLFVRRILLSF
jgi:hypothetical protein